MSRVESQSKREKIFNLCKTYNIQVDPEKQIFCADVGMIYDMIDMSEQLDNLLNRENEVVKIETIKQKDL